MRWNCTRNGRYVQQQQALLYSWYVPFRYLRPFRYTFVSASHILQIRQQHNNAESRL